MTTRPADGETPNPHPASLTGRVFMEPYITVIVVAYRGTDRLERCLRSLVVSEVPATLDVLVVANAPTPEVDAVLESAESELGVRVVRSTVNRGLAGGLRLGRSVADARTSHLGVVQDDVEVGAKTVGGLLEALETVRGAGAACARTTYPDGTLERGPLALLEDGRVGDVAPSVTKVDRPFAVDAVTSSCVLLRTDAWDGCGGPDPRFHPLQHVDVELACSLRADGWLLLHDPRHPACHLRSASSPGTFKSFLDERHRRVFVPRWAEQIERRRGIAPGSLASMPEPGGGPRGATRLLDLDPAAADPHHPDAERWFADLAAEVDREYHVWLEKTLASSIEHARLLEEQAASATRFARSLEAALERAETRAAAAERYAASLTETLARKERETIAAVEAAASLHAQLDAARRQ